MKLLPKNILEIKTEMKIANILVFIAAFIFITVGLIFLNSIYSNIFKFDFSPVSMRDSLSVASTVSKNDPELEMNQQLSKKADPIAIKDSATANNNNNNNSNTNTNTDINLAKDSVITPPSKAKLIPQVIPVKNKPAETGGIRNAKYTRKNTQEETFNQTAPANENEMVINTSKMDKTNSKIV